MQFVNFSISYNIVNVPLVIGVLLILCGLLLNACLTPLRPNTSSRLKNQGRHTSKELQGHPCWASPKLAENVHKKHFSKHYSGLILLSTTNLLLLTLPYINGIILTTNLIKKILDFNL